MQLVFTEKNKNPCDTPATKLLLGLSKIGIIVNAKGGGYEATARINDILNRPIEIVCELVSAADAVHQDAGDKPLQCQINGARDDRKNERLKRAMIGAGLNYEEYCRNMHAVAATNPSPPKKHYRKQKQASATSPAPAAAPFGPDTNGAQANHKCEPIAMSAPRMKTTSALRSPDGVAQLRRKYNDLTHHANDPNNSATLRAQLEAARVTAGIELADYVAEHPESVPQHCA